MANIYERHVSRNNAIDAKTAELSLEYVVTGSMDESEVFQLVAATSPIQFYYLTRAKISNELQGGGIWFCKVDYRTIDIQEAVGVDPQETPEDEAEEGPPNPTVSPIAPMSAAYAFDCSAATVHITQSLETRGMWTAAGKQPNPNNAKAIGLTKEEIKGTDIFAPKFEWSLEVQRNKCTLKYLKTLSGLAGRVNYGKAFYGFDKGSVLYLGATGRYTFADKWTISHRFAVSPEEAFLVISDDITVTFKYGWDYIWVGYEPRIVGGNNGQLLQVPKAAYVEQVYQEGDFKKLEIGE